MENLGDSVITEPAKSYEPRSDEIDLVDLFQKLWQQKLLIIVCTMVFTLCAAVYAWNATPYYQVKSLLRPAPLKDLDAINSTGVYKLSPKEALQRVGASLDSYSLRSQFFREKTSLFEPLKKGSRSLEEEFEIFNEKSFTLLQPDPKKTDNLTPFVGMQLVYPEYVDGVAILNGLVQQAITDERRRVVEDLEGVIQNRLNEIERQMQSARASYEAGKESTIAQLSEGDTLQRAILQDELKALRGELRAQRINRITQLDEAIAIAKSLGITKPTNPTSLGNTGEALGQGNVFRTEVISQQFPLHFMGTEALEAERSILLKRRSDDHTDPKIATIQSKLEMLEHNRKIEIMQKRQNEDLFLTQLAEMREEAARLKSIKLDLDNFNLVRIDQPAIMPLRPIKPKKLMILAIGVVLGGMLGVFAALVRTMITSRPKAA